MALKFIKTVYESEKIPRFYGVAWGEWARTSVVCMPVPFNVVARVLRDAWCYLRHPGAVPFNPRAAYLQGVADGRMSTFDTLARMGVELGRREDQS